jgi:ATP-dependent Clp protease ATP-binding subunit ClpC
VFERFSEEARQVVVLAQDEARALGHNYIGTDHLLVSLLRDETGWPARVLESFGVHAGSVRVRVVDIVGSSDDEVAGQIPFTPRA